MRLVLSAVGIALGVAMMLLAASAGPMLQAALERMDATTGSLERNSTSAANPLYVRGASTQFGSKSIHGDYIAASGSGAPKPPGVEWIPGPDEIVLSPELATLLASPEGALLRPRFPQKVIGAVGPEGLPGFKELRFYAGANVTPEFQENAMKVYSYGENLERTPLPPPFWLLLAAGIVAMLVPVAVFVTTATRLGGERRDRRLAALRLIGMSSRQVRRVAATEALVAAVLGLVGGTGIFLAIRPLAVRFNPLEWRLSASDVHPSVFLAIAIAVSVPLLAVVTSVFALRNTAIEPLGVVRLAETQRRRLWWRLIPIIMGIGLLLSQAGKNRSKLETLDQVTLVAGIAFLLFSIPVLLPWIVEFAVRVMHRGAPSWQLAVRRLQLDSGTVARVAGGVAVVLAGTIALHTVMTTMQIEHSENIYPELKVRAQVVLDPEVADHTEKIISRLQGAPGIVAVHKDRTYNLNPTSGTDPLPERVVLVVALAPDHPEAIEHVRNAAADLQWNSKVQYAGVRSDTERLFQVIQAILLGGAFLVMLLSGANLLIVALENIRERRRHLATLSACGVPRKTMVGSLLWQYAIPMAFAVGIAVPAGTGLSLLLLGITTAYSHISMVYNVSGIALLVGFAFALTLVMTALTLPALRRATHSTGLRAE
ncbi:MAG: FtsX-like permease family protein [Longispora sp.]|nr:FtsX-like permease family protein [Longispora sp. (in: high G+C Gram-positive bacteria)]